MYVWDIANEHRYLIRINLASPSSAILHFSPRSSRLWRTPHRTSFPLRQSPLPLHLTSRTCHPLQRFSSRTHQVQKSQVSRHLRLYWKKKRLDRTRGMSIEY